MGMNRSCSDPSLSTSTSQSASASDLEKPPSSREKSDQIPLSSNLHVVFNSSGSSHSKDSGETADKKEEFAARQLEPTDSGPDQSWSIGSELHHLGQCSPC